MKNLVLIKFFRKTKRKLVNTNVFHLHWHNENPWVAEQILTCGCKLLRFINLSILLVPTPLYKVFFSSIQQLSLICGRQKGLTPTVLTLWCQAFLIFIRTIKRQWYFLHIRFKNCHLLISLPKCQDGTKMDKKLSCTVQSNWWICSAEEYLKHYKVATS